jgi:GntR family transcriptional repressor for pyruvate dehydrogenase complex
MTLTKYFYRSTKMNSISDEIYKSIERKIVDGELQPGDKLPSENELCEVWNTSRISVRQAFERLMSLGLLNKVQGGGTYISKPDPAVVLSPLLAYVIFSEESVNDILVFRNIIEVGSVALCAINRNQENLDKLRQCLSVMEASLIDSNAERFNDADLEFHMEIARGSKTSLNIKNTLISILQLKIKTINLQLILWKNIFKEQLMNWKLLITNQVGGNISNLYVSKVVNEF